MLTVSVTQQQLDRAARAALLKALKKLPRNPRLGSTRAEGQLRSQRCLSRFAAKCHPSRLQLAPPLYNPLRRTSACPSSRYVSQGNWLPRKFPAAGGQQYISLTCSAVIPASKYFFLLLLLRAGRSVAERLPNAA